MKSGTNQRTRFGGRNTDFGRLTGKTFNWRAAATIAAALSLTTISVLARNDGLQATLAADQSVQTMTAGHHADVIQDILDAINGIVGGGSSSGTTNKPTGSQQP